MSTPASRFSDARSSRPWSGLVSALRRARLSSGFESKIPYSKMKFFVLPQNVEVFLVKRVSPLVCRSFERLAAFPCQLASGKASDDKVLAHVRNVAGEPVRVVVFRIAPVDRVASHIAAADHVALNSNHDPL